MVIKTTNTKLGEAVKQFRIERDWTLQRLSDFTGVHLSTLNKIENQVCQPNARTLYKLRKAIPSLEPERQPTALANQNKVERRRATL